MITAAVMQPYFVPYAGYFGLIAGADVFVVLDCVQFPRRGWVHRNRLEDNQGRPGWLSLPIQKAPRTTLIRDLRFRPGAAERMREQARRFPALRHGADEELVGEVLAVSGEPSDYLLRLLELVCRRLELPTDFVRSSELGLDPALRRQDRILAAAEAVGAGRYLNLPGGRELYRQTDFQRRGVALGFLPTYAGPNLSILQRLLTEDPRELSRDVLRHAGGAQWPA